jgi:D-glycero-D-manno-heptose 1,7-bisphosphate phosphatase
MIDKPLNTLFLDRDGVLNKKINFGYVLKVEDIEICDDARLFLHWAKTQFKNIIVITNQQCIGKKFISFDELNAINNHINKLLGMPIDRFYVCPHLVEDHCICRKPNAELFLRAANAYDIQFNKSWMIGDSETDLIPAYSLGIKSVYISDSFNKYADLIVPSISYLYHNQRLIY